MTYLETLITKRDQLNKEIEMIGVCNFFINLFDTNPEFFKNDQIIHHRELRIKNKWDLDYNTIDGLSQNLDKFNNSDLDSVGILINILESIK